MRIESAVSGLDQAEAIRRARLVDSARQFEGMMLSEMLKGLKFSSLGSDAEEGGAETMRGFGTEALGKAIAAGGGFGLARQVVRQVTREDHRTKGI